MRNMTSFTLFWLTGDKEVVEGENIAEAFNSVYSSGAIRALDFYTTTSDEDDKWEWCPTLRTWGVKKSNT